jgi:hypothetical protein
MRKTYRRALAALTVLGLAGFLMFAVDPAAHAAATVLIPPTPGLVGVWPDGGYQLNTTPSQYPERDGVAYHIWNWSWGCMDADSDTIRQNGGKVQLFECNDSVYQQWFLDRTGVDGLYRIRTVYRPDGCLDADNSVPAGGRLQVWHCLDMNQHNQLWWLVTTFFESRPVVRLQSDWNGQCIQVSGDAGFGSWLVLADCAGASHAAWWPIDTSHGPDWPFVPVPD